GAVGGRGDPRCQRKGATREVDRLITQLPGPLAAVAYPGWPQVLRYRRRRAMAVRRVPAYRERWGPSGPERSPWVSEAELDTRPWTVLPLGVDVPSLPPSPPSAAGIVAAVALSAPLRPWTTVLECRRDWRPTGR